MIQYLLVFLGGGLGAAVRHAVNIGSARLVGTDFPFGTMFINASESTDKSRAMSVSGVTVTG